MIAAPSRLRLPSTSSCPPILRFFSIPTPPSTIRAPVSLELDSVATLILMSAPVKDN
tara:strand:- start:27380 stop:27550 length:171 start_codon:yes stop_codon:yes gene_type:complete